MVRGQRSRQHAGAAAALAAYTLLSIALFGRGVIGAPGDRVVGDGGADKSIFMWAFEWWPYAIAKLEDPLDANVVWMPHNIDLAWVADVPLASVAAWPLTYLAGPVVTYNVLALAAPAVSAWTAFLLCRRVTAGMLPSLFGGFTFGFSSYQIGQTVGHLHLTLVFLIPLCALVVLDRYEERVSRRRAICLLAAALLAQLLLSTELFALLLLSGATYAIVVLWRFQSAQRARARAVMVEVAIAVVAALTIASPYLLHAFASREAQPVRSPTAESADILNLVVPTRRTMLRPPGSESVTQRFTATGAERGAYLGIPLIAILALFASQRPLSRVRQSLLFGAAALALASLGPRVHVAGHVVGVGPWWPLAKLPISDGALPVRMSVFVSLLVSLCCALWLADRGDHPLARWLLAGIAVVALLPTFSGRLWVAEVPRSSYFSNARYTHHIAPGETALVLPYGPGGWSLLWQAEAGFRMRLVGGHFGRWTTPAEADWNDVYRSLGPRTLPGGPSRLREFLAAHDVAVVVVGPGTPATAARLVRNTFVGEPAIRSGDALVYRTRPLSGAARER